MDAQRKLIVGYDLCDDFTQISCYSYKAQEPITISKREGEDYYPIPTALCVKSETKQWLFGEEAVACAKAGAGVIADHLLTKLRMGEEVEIFHQTFTPVALLEKFLRKTLTLVKDYFPTEPITKLVVTVRNTEPAFVDKIYEALSMLGIEKDRAIVMSHAGVYLYYALSQDRSLWMNDVGLFDFNEEGLSYYQIRMNRRTKPMIAELTKSDYSDSLKYGDKNTNMAYSFENLANTILYKQIVTTLYFTGKGFDGGWADDVVKNLCIGRRAFFGQNLYTKGACYAAKELSGDQKLGDFLLLNDDMVISSVSVRVYCDTTYKELSLIKAGETWYEIDKSIEVIAEKDTELEIIKKNIMTGNVEWERKQLKQFPERPNRTTRLKINLTCMDKFTGRLQITDLGFGEFYPATGECMEYMIEI